MAALLDVIDVSKDYGPLRALDGVRFQVHEGEMFGLLGPNGAGKTTLLSIISGLLSPTSGEIFLGGKRFSAADRQVRHLLGIVPQELAIYGDLTARENLEFFGELYGLRGTALKAKVIEVLKATSLQDKADERTQTYSGGMKRRLNLGVALMHSPRLLLLDEPTVGVDPQSRNHIFEEVRRLNAQGLTVVYTSHYMEEVQALCPRIGIINQGKLQACDTLPNLLKELEGLIRFRVPALTPGLRARIKDFPDCTLSEEDATTFTLNCREVNTTLLRLVSALSETNIELIHLETEEPNLERVFLHLTGRDLRD